MSTFCHTLASDSAVDKLAKPSIASSPHPSRSAMRLLAWNVNHRAKRQQISPAVADAIIAESPDVVVLTEYVVGDDHEPFLEQLATAGLSEVEHTTEGTTNRVLIATRTPMQRQELDIPAELTWVPRNILHVRLPDSGLEVVGFRMPAFEREEKPLKRKTWDWLLEIQGPKFGRPCVLLGDFNTSPTNSDKACGDIFHRFLEKGWQFRRPAGTHSFGKKDVRLPLAIDHAMCAGDVRMQSVRYSWDFQNRPELYRENNTPGIPDHAMLIVDVELGSANGGVT